jgi:hypothetical protein
MADGRWQALDAATLAWYASSVSELTIARQAIAHRGRRLEYFTIVKDPRRLNRFRGGSRCTEHLACRFREALLHRGYIWCHIALEDVRWRQC